MEGVEIVITPRTIERAIFLTIIAVLLIVVVVRWDGGCSVAKNDTETGAVASIPVAQQEPVENTSVTDAATSAADPCKNGQRDNSETDVDCGGSCGGCAEYKACNLDGDCDEGLYCFQHIKCLKPTCDDGLKNQDETEIDCGGTCKGYWWKVDKSCHTKPEPSGKLDATMSANVGRSPNSGNAIVQDVTISLENGLDRDLSLDILLFARTSNGGVIFENQDGEISIATVKLTVDSTEKITKKISLENNTRATLPGIKSSDAFEIVAVVKDTVRKTVLEEFTWTNS